ncbi:MAG: DUF255 domain-containing protein, partial [Planctomycetota bacterium]|nr:DUF255 domain-containing protein [Planctomycetota bacterium]
MPSSLNRLTAVSLLFLLGLVLGCSENTPVETATPPEKTTPQTPPSTQAEAVVQPTPPMTPEDKPSAAPEEPAAKPAATPDHGKSKAAPEKQRTNRLSGETSPYLLLHAHNPVDWFPWGPEALQKARKEGKMIFLSIGYSSCYWCHVMERESFSDPEIAKFMNEHFVNIKIDREERPDIDDIYMTALGIYVTQTGGGTGWPLSMFLTPDTRPVAGGTYFPPRDQSNRPPGFLGVLQAMHKLWTQDKKSAEDNATVLTKALRQSLRRRLVLASAELDTELVGASVASLINSHDTRYGGIGFNRSRADRPKFPTPPKLELLAHIARLEKNSKDEEKPATAVLDHTLLAIANGGIHDQVGGGFHRYSTDRRWHVPHFEKMLYDNAQLA